MLKRIFVSSLLFFTTQYVLADYITNTVVNGCDDNAYYRAVFTIKQPTCANGYFLPANTESCKTCPSGYTCDGGTFTFNETESQGAIYSSTITNDMNNICAENAPGALRAVFTPKTINCPAGKYLTANSIVCDTDCPLNHYCPGGNLTFNETTPQGIIECPSNHPFAPAGMWLASQCGRKLHVGADVLYMHQSPANPTLHSLNVLYSLNNTQYSANAVLRDMTPGAPFPKVSAGASKGLHILIHETLNGVEGDYEYLICDDSVPECRNAPPAN